MSANANGVPTLVRRDGTPLYAAPRLFDGEEPSWFYAAALFAAIAVGLLGLAGLVVSFATVRAAAAGELGRNAWIAPLAIDIGIFAFSLLDIVLARMNMRMAWLRFVPWTLIGVTIYLNVEGAATTFGVVLHAALPALWAVAVEVGTTAIRIRAGLASGELDEGVPLWRWLLAPRETPLMWRRMKLWGIKRYAHALDDEQARVLVLADLKDSFGWWWRLRAPRRIKAYYRLRQYDRAQAELESRRPRRELEASTGGGEGGGAVIRPAIRQWVTVETPATPSSSDEVDESAAAVTPLPYDLGPADTELDPQVIDTARKVAEEIRAAGMAVTRDGLAAGIRARRGRCSNHTASKALRFLRQADGTA